MDKLVNDYHRLWIGPEWFIPVAADGHCSSAVFEGTLGAIVQLHDVAGRHRALKVPRIRADTLRENAYIVELLRDEANCVHKVGGSITSGLLPADRNFRYGPIYEEIQFSNMFRDHGDSAREEQRLQNGQFIALSFSAGKQPRFLGLRPKSEDQSSEWEAFPPSAMDDPRVTELLEKMPEIGQELAKGASALFALTTGGDKAALVGTIAAFLETSSFTNLWIIAPPSIAYDWADANLQELLSRAKSPLADWSVSQHLNLASRVFRGLRWLHDKGCLHGDIRPANIMATGQAPDDPDAYVLCDYGSFGSAAAGGQDVGPPSGGEPRVRRLTLGRERQSPFYAPERRGGRELEEADSAFVVEASDGYVVLLGWRNHLTQMPRDALQTLPQLVAAFKDWQPVQVHDDAPTGGDQLQIGQHLFEVRQSGTLRVGKEQEAYRIYGCTKNVWRVFHDKLVIQEHQKDIPTNDIVDLPNTREVYQWSSATDVYGAGAVFLHGLLRSHGGPFSDTLFHQCLATLRGVPYFQAIWSQLNTLCLKLLEGAAAELKANKDASEQPFDAKAFAKEENDWGGKPGRQSLQEACLRTATIIIRTTPGMRPLLDKCSGNGAIFLLVVHFVLSCIHRKSSLREPISQAGARFPFCASRLERSSGAAAAAIAHIDALSASMQTGAFRWMVFELAHVEKNLVKIQMPDFDPRTQESAAIEKTQAEEELKKMVADLQARQKREAELVREKNEMVADLQARQSREADLVRERDEMEQSLGLERSKAIAKSSEMMRQLEDLQRAVASEGAALEAAKKLVERLSSELAEEKLQRDRLQGQIARLRTGLESIRRKAESIGQAGFAQRAFAGQQAKDLALEAKNLSAEP